MDKYKTLEVLGHGSYGSVYKAEQNETGELVAIKKMKKKYTNWEECKNLREVKSLNSLKHENIIKLKEMIREDDILNLVFEYMESNLYELMKTKELKKFREDEIKNIITQILKGIAYMHKYGFFHRDMKPENILVKNNTIKLADFGLAREIRSIPPYTEYVSTRWYRAPECLLSSNNYNSPIDIWAIGTIIAELYNQKPLFPGNNNKDMLLKICKVIGPVTQTNWPDGLKLSKKIEFKFPNVAQFGSESVNNEHSIRSIIKDASQDAITFIESILQWDPNKRPTAQDLLNHPYLSNISIFKELDNNTGSKRNRGIAGESANEDRLKSVSKLRLGSKKNKNSPEINKILENIKNERKLKENALEYNNKISEYGVETGNFYNYSNNIYDGNNININPSSNFNFISNNQNNNGFNIRNSDFSNLGENKKFQMNFMNSELQAKKIFEKKKIYPKEKDREKEKEKNEYESKYKNDFISEEIQEDISNILPQISNKYKRDHLINKNSRLNNLLKFNNINTNLNNISNGLLNNYNGFDRDRENSGIKKRNFFEEEKNIFGKIKENLEKDIENKPVIITKNRDYSLNDKDLSRNYHLKLNNINNIQGINNSNMKENKGININLNNANNFGLNYNPVFTNINHNKEFNFNLNILKQKNFDFLNTNDKEKEFKENLNNFPIIDESFKKSKKKWDFDINYMNNNMIVNNKRDNENNIVPIYNSRRKLNALNMKVNNVNENNGMLNKIDNIDNNNLINDGSTVKFDSRRYHLLNKKVI